MIRVIVPGTRHATREHRAEIGPRLNAIARRDLGVLVHGAARGVDSIAADLAKAWGWQVEPMPAVWPDCGPDCPARPHRKVGPAGTYCPRAGARRNQQMVDLEPRADVAVCFPAVGSGGRSGTWDLAARAADGGIPVQVWPLRVSLPATVRVAS